MMKKTDEKSSLFRYPHCINLFNISPIIKMQNILPKIQISHCHPFLPIMLKRHCRASKMEFLARLREKCGTWTPACNEVKTRRRIEYEQLFGGWIAVVMSERFDINDTRCCRTKCALATEDLRIPRISVWVIFVAHFRCANPPSACPSFMTVIYHTGYERLFSLLVYFLPQK